MTSIQIQLTCESGNFRNITYKEAHMSANTAAAQHSCSVRTFHHANSQSTVYSCVTKLIEAQNGCGVILSGNSNLKLNTKTVVF